MKVNVCYRVGILLATIAFIAGHASGVTAAPPGTPSEDRGILRIEYDRDRDLLWLEAHHAPVDKVLRSVSEAARIAIQVPKQGLLKGQISVNMSGVPLEQALGRLLSGYNTTTSYSSTSHAPSSGPAPSSRLEKVVVLSEKEVRPVGLQGARPHGKPSADQGVLTERKLSEVAAITQALKAPGGDMERERAVDSLLRLVNDRTSSARHDAMLALKDLAPERAVDSLTMLLQDQHEDRQARMAAASLLGQIGDPRAVDPLMSAFNERDPAIQRAAASGLARIGGERSVGFLLRVFSGNDANLHQTAAMALAFYGDNGGRAALARAISQGHVAPAGLPKDVIDTLSRPR